MKKCLYLLLLLAGCTVNNYNRKRESEPPSNEKLVPVVLTTFGQTETTQAQQVFAPFMDIVRQLGGSQLIAHLIGSTVPAGTPLELWGTSDLQRGVPLSGQGLIIHDFIWTGGVTNFTAAQLTHLENTTTEPTTGRSFYWLIARIPT